MRNKIEPSAFLNGIFSVLFSQRIVTTLYIRKQYCEGMTFKNYKTLCISVIMKITLSGENSVKKQRLASVIRTVFSTNPLCHQPRVFPCVVRSWGRLRMIDCQVASHTINRLAFLSFFVSFILFYLHFHFFCIRIF